MKLAPALLRTVGWRFLIVNGDPLVTDRSLFVAPWLVGADGERRTLDAGCGNGGFCFQAASVSEGSVLGISDDEPAIAKATARANVLGFGDKVRFRHLDLRWRDQVAQLGEFDQILLLETIEHVRDDRGLVELLAARLRPGGRMILTTPSSDHTPLAGEGRHLSGGVEDGRHVRWGYSQEELVALVRAAGLEPEYIAPVGGVLMRSATSLTTRLSRVVGKPLAMLIMSPSRLLRPLDPLLTRLLRAPSHCWGVVAVRLPALDSH